MVPIIIDFEKNHLQVAFPFLEITHFRQWTQCLILMIPDLALPGKRIVQDLLGAHPVSRPEHQLLVADEIEPIKIFK